MRKILFGKKVFAYFTFFLISTLLIGCGSQSSSSGENVKSGKKSDDVIELTINNWAASTHHYAYNVYEPWKELVEEKTNGQVKVNLYHGASLGKPASVYQDVKGGLYDVGLLAVAYFTDTDFFPYSIGNLPFAIDNPVQGKKVMTKFAEEYVKDDITDVIVMDPFTSEPYNIFSTKPIKSVKDVKKLKIRGSDKSETELIKSLGGVPVSITVDDTYEGLQKNSIDATFYSPVGAVGYKFFEPAPYITKLNVAATTLIPVMNQGFYDKLPEDLQKLFDEELNPALSELFSKTYETELNEALEKLEEAVAKRGEMMALSKEEEERFKEAGESAWDVWIKDANERGYDGEKMVEEFRHMLEEEK